MKKVFVTILIIIIFLFCNITVVYGADSNIFQIAMKWLNLGKTESAKKQISWTGFNDLAGILWGVGIFTVLIVGTVLGIKYMFASVEEKATIKETLKPFIIGSVIILGALGIWTFLVEFFDSLV